MSVCELRNFDNPTKGIIIFCLLILLSCSSKKNDYPLKIHNNEYLDKSVYALDINRLEKLYRDSKWRMYSIQCDDTVHFADNNLAIDENITYASLDLRLVSYEQRHDTINLYWLYYYKDTIACTQRNVYNLRFSGMGYHYPYKVPFAYIGSSESYYIWDPRPNSRLVEPLQPEVLAFLNNNKDKIIPWYKEEAIRRGIFNY